MAEVIADRVSERYGPIGFTAATVNVFVGSLAAWMSFPYFLLYVYFVPLILVDVVAAAILASYTGKLGQAGRGMLIGLLSVPLSPAVIWTGLLVGLRH